MQQIKASDCKCIMCKKPAVCFWPAIDPDIPAHPYCRECVEKAKIEMLIALSEMAQEDGLYK